MNTFEKAAKDLHDNWGKPRPLYDKPEEVKENWGEVALYAFLFAGFGFLIVRTVMTFV